MSSALALPASTSVAPDSMTKPGITRVLLVCHLLSLPYRVMLCLRAAGVNYITILGGKGSVFLASSRLCSRFILASHNIRSGDPALIVTEINQHARASGCEMIVPGDQHATRALSALRTELCAPCFPMPDREIYDQLYDKRQFLALCREVGVLAPTTWMVPDRQAMLDAAQRGELRLPAICKPIDAEGGDGIMKLTSGNLLRQIVRIDYAPIMLQEFIDGEDIGASVYCERGRIVAFVAHYQKRSTYYTFQDRGIYDSVASLMARIGCDGVYNFDMRRGGDGRIWFLECNPRFFLKMAMSMWAGMNFVQPAVCPGEVMPRLLPDGRYVRMPKALLADMFVRPHRLSRHDFAALCALARDWWPFLMDLRGRWQDQPAAINYYMNA